MKMHFAGSMALGALIALASATATAAALAPGTVAPRFTAQASQAGKQFTFSLADALKKGPVVVYFYPSAYTSGCDLEAHTFAVNRDKFDAAGATIIGVSADSIDRLDVFRQTRTTAPASSRSRRTPRSRSRFPTAWRR